MAELSLHDIVKITKKVRNFPAKDGNPKFTSITLTIQSVTNEEFQVVMFTAKDLPIEEEQR